MAETFLLEIVTPKNLLICEGVEELTASGAKGQFGILPGHANFITTIKPGEVSFKQGKKISYLAVSSGFAEIAADRAVLLVESAERAEDVDIEGINADIARIQEKLGTINEEDSEYAEMTAALEIATIKKSVADKITSHKTDATN